VIHLMQIARKIEEIGVAAIGDDLFLFTMPADVQNAVMVRSPLTGDPIDPEQPNVYSSEFLIVVRHSDEEAAFAKCQKISEALTIDRKMLGEIWVTQCRPRTRPIPYPRNEGGTVEWGIPFVISWGEQAP
jgi:hypothetical protein